VEVMAAGSDTLAGKDLVDIQITADVAEHFD
jgi:hypothetical protein